MVNLKNKAERAYNRKKRNSLRWLKVNLWLFGAYPRKWEYEFDGENWKAFTAVDDIIIYADTGYYFIFTVIYYAFDKRIVYRFNYWSDVKEFLGKLIVEQGEDISKCLHGYKDSDDCPDCCH